MEKPKIENYKLGKGFHTHDFVSDLTLYSDQVESENKELIEGIKNAINLLPCGKALKSLYPDSEENKSLIKAIDQLNILIN